METKKYAIGVDYGTNSVRAVIIDISDGEEIASYVYNYEKGKDGIILDSKNHNVARQHPVDYIQGLETCIKKVLNRANKNRKFDIVGIGVDTTGSTPLPVDREGVPLGLKKEFRNNRNALAWLWKDHSGYGEAEEITELAKKEYPQYVNKCGGIYSSEWFFSKILHCLRADPVVFDAAYSWVELCDFIPALLSGNIKPENIKRGICAAGHKAMFNKEYGGLPSKEFLAKLNPKLADLRDRLYANAYPAGIKAGNISKKYAKMFGLSEDTAISVGAFDAHMGAVGAGIAPGSMVKIIGTSTCDMAVAPKTETITDIPGLCGIVDGSILPGYWGLEAGQSAVGDILYWFVDNFVRGKEYGKDPHKFLSKKAGELSPGETGLLTIDWHNGNRTVLVDQRLTGLTVGFTLGTKPEHIYRSIIEGTAFGAKIIISRFEKYGVKINDLICTGGIADKNPVFMQVYADVLDRELKVAKSNQTCALGAAIFGIIAAGREKSGYEKIEDIQKKICGIKKVYTPGRENVSKYKDIFGLYKQLHDTFGTKKQEYNLFNVMKELLKK